MRLNGLSLDLSSLQIRKPSPSSPQDSGFTSTSTPSLSNTCNTPTTPQDSHSSFSSISAGSKSPEDDPNVWVNPALKSQLGRSAFIQPDHINDDIQFTDRPQSYRPAFESPHSDPFHVKSFPISPGFFCPSINDDSVAQLASARGANRGVVQSNDIPSDASSQTAWTHLKESMGRSKLVGAYGSDPRTEFEASMHAFHGVSPYTQGRLNLPPSPATHISTLLSANDLFPQPKNMQYPTSASPFVPNFQIPHALTSPTPRPVPPAIAATMSTTQFLPQAGLSPRGDIFQDNPRPLQAAEALAQGSFSAAFDPFPHLQNVPTSSPRHLSQDTTHGHHIRTPPAPVHEASLKSSLQPGV